MKYISTLIALFLFAGVAHAQPLPVGNVQPPAGMQWQLVVDDEFANDSGINTSLWNGASGGGVPWCDPTTGFSNMDQFADPWGCSEFYGTPPTAPYASIIPGVGLAVQDFNDTNTRPSGAGGFFMALQSFGKVVQRFGYWEVAVKEPTDNNGEGDGLHTDVWITPPCRTNFIGTGPTFCQDEVDIAEKDLGPNNHNQYAFTVFDSNVFVGGSEIQAGNDMTANFNVVGAAWTPDNNQGVIRGFLNGNQIGQSNSLTDGGWAQGAWMWPGWMIGNNVNAFEGGVNVDSSTSNNNPLLIKYARIWALVPIGPTPTPTTTSTATPTATSTPVGSITCSPHIVSPPPNSTVSGTITLSTTTNCSGGTLGTDWFVKWWAPTLPCSNGCIESSTTFTYDTTQAANGIEGFLTQIVDGGGNVLGGNPQTDVVNYTFANGVPTVTPTVTATPTVTSTPTSTATSTATATATSTPGSGLQPVGNPAPPPGTQWQLVTDDEFATDRGINQNLWNGGTGNGVPWCVSNSSPPPPFIDRLNGDPEDESKPPAGGSCGQFFGTPGVAPYVDILSGVGLASQSLSSLDVTQGFWMGLQGFNKTILHPGSYIEYSYKIPTDNAGEGDGLHTDLWITPQCRSDFVNNPSIPCQAEFDLSETNGGPSNHGRFSASVLDQNVFNVNNDIETGVDLTAGFNVVGGSWVPDSDQGTVTSFFNGNPVFGPVALHDPGWAQGAYPFVGWMQQCDGTECDGFIGGVQTSSNTSNNNPFLVQYVRIWNAVPVGSTPTPTVTATPTPTATACVPSRGHPCSTPTPIMCGGHGQPPCGTSTPTATPTSTPCTGRGCGTPGSTPTPRVCGGHGLPPCPTTTATTTATPTATGTPAGSTAAFLNSMGVGSHVVLGGTSPSQLQAGIQYTGIKHIREDFTCDPSMGCPDNFISDFIGIHQATGALFHTLPGIGPGTSPGGVGFNVNVWKELAAAGALDDLIEGPNEVNNFPFTYIPTNVVGGPTVACGPFGGEYLGCGEYQAELYKQVHADPVIGNRLVASMSGAGPGSETDNIGLQFPILPFDLTTVPAGLLPAGTPYADLVNLHNYIAGNGDSTWIDNLAWNTFELGTGSEHDGMDGEYCIATWAAGFPAAPLSQCASIPRITTETGWPTNGSVTEDQQGKMLIETYATAFARGWYRTYIYQLKDDAPGDFGLYDVNGNPKPSATYIHNMTTILNNNPGPWLIIWADRPASDNLTEVVNLPISGGIIYDPTVGTQGAASTQVTLTDHMFMVQFSGAAPATIDGLSSTDHFVVLQ